MNEVDELLELRECYIFSLSRKFFVKQGPDLFYLLSLLLLEKTKLFLFKRYKASTPQEHVDEVR